MPGREPWGVGRIDVGAGVAGFDPLTRADGRIVARLVDRVDQLVDAGERPRCFWRHDQLHRLVEHVVAGVVACVVAGAVTVVVGG